MSNVRQFPPQRRRRNPPPPPPGGWPAWRSLLATDERGRVIADLSNVLVGLRGEPCLETAFRFNEMRQESWLHAPVPNGHPGESPPKKINDDDISRLQEWLQASGIRRVGREIVGQAVEERAREFRYHPVREYLESLTWDGTKRIDHWLTRYMMAKGNYDYLAAIGSMFLIAMVARIFEPGCKCDYMLVLEGGQGSQKSAACSILAGAEYFSDSLGDVTGKDAKQHMRGKWLVEESELANFGRATTESLKAFLTRTTEKYRPPYAKHQVEERRQCVIVGTTNKTDWNKDDTGARRFWPVTVGDVIDVEGLRRDRDQLFAEAVCLYKNGAQWWPDRAFEARVIKPEQEARRQIDVWEEPIFKYLRGVSRRQISVMDVAIECLELEKGRVGTADQNRIKSAMSLAGWRKDPKRTERGYLWEFVRDVANEANDGVEYNFP